MASETTVITGLVRLSYAHIWEPVAAKGSTEKKYSCALLIPKEDKDTYNNLLAAAKKAAQIKFGEKLPKGVKNSLDPKSTDADNPFLIKDGDKKTDEDDNTDPNYEGHWYINASSKTKPGIVKKVGKKLMEIEDEETVYSGCFVRVSVNAFGYDNVNKGISFGLNNILFIKDGEPLAGRANAATDFADVLGEDQEEDDLL